ncbi:MAG TPA: radical SAM protein [Myxococcota bacterium]|nr:radical SAM protein [Myxococcota bacterium]HQK50182.1 radical SAM protein [Myxococcota bacterium]
MRIAGGTLDIRDLRRLGLPLVHGGFDLFLGTRWLRHPLALTWAVVEQCPLRCRHCDMKPRSGPRRDPLELARRVARSGVRWVSLIGGEPLLLRELPDVLLLLKRSDKFVSLGTSGAGLAEHLDELVQASLDLLVVSVDGLRPQDHDTFRNRPGLLQEIEASVERLHHRKGRHPQLIIRVTLHRDNLEDIPAIVARWRQRADRVVLQAAMNNSIHPVRDHGVLLRAEDLPRLRRVLKALGNQWPEYRRRYYALLPSVLEHPVAAATDFRCLVVPSLSAVLMPDGTVLACYGRPESVLGNLAEEEMENLWRGPTAQQVRQAMESKQRSCFCWEAIGMDGLDLLPWLKRTRAVSSLLRSLAH